MMRFYANLLELFPALLERHHRQGWKRAQRRSDQLKGEIAHLATQAQQNTRLLHEHFDALMAAIARRP